MKLSSESLACHNFYLTSTNVDPVSLQLPTWESTWLGLTQGLRPLIHGSNVGLSRLPPFMAQYNSIMHK